jgi:hypothetical protein
MNNEKESLLKEMLVMKREEDQRKLEAEIAR